MPGSPYFDETPKGILTWPKLLKVGIPVAAISILAGWHFDVLIELLMVVTGVLTILAITRKSRELLANTCKCEQMPANTNTYSKTPAITCKDQQLLASTSEY